jgi:hypothetical protein
MFKSEIFQQKSLNYKLSLIYDIMDAPKYEDNVKDTV